MSNSSNDSEVYCYAPFYHSHVDSEGLNRLCCIASNVLVEKGFQADLQLPPLEFWNSSYMKNRRLQMTRGESPPECLNCRTPNTTYLYKDVFKRNFQAQYEKDRASIQSDQTVSFMPHSVDYRTAICNLKCLMCHSGSSTAINAQFKKQTDAIAAKFGSEYVQYHENLLSKSERTFSTLEQIVKGQNLRYVYFAGGEPTMTKDHLGLLDLIYSNKKDVLDITYNTNLMQSSVFVKAWKERLEKFEHVGIFCSIDAVGEIGEYVRDGLSVAQFEKNLAILLENKKSEFQIFLDATITSLGLFNSVELAQFALKYRVPIRGRLVIESSRSKCMLVGFLAKNVREKILSKFESFYASLDESSKLLINEFRDSIHLAVNEPELTKEMLRIADEDIEFMRTLYPNKISYGQMIQQQLRAL